MSSIKQITEYSNAGYRFKVIMRKGDFALSEGHNKFGSVCYEVFKVFNQGEYEYQLAGITLKTTARELKPYNHHFGKTAFSFTKIENAIKKLSEL